MILFATGCGDAPDTSGNVECNVDDNCGEAQRCCDKLCIPASAICRVEDGDTVDDTTHPPDVVGTDTGTVDTAGAADTAAADSTPADTTFVDTTTPDTAEPVDTSTPDVAPTCAPDCMNGGACVATNSCDCAGTGHAGPTCGIPICGDVTCPELAGYVAACNTREHCEYSRTADTAEWHADDVWIWLPPGSFQMGDERAPPAHTVTFASGFFVAKYPVTARVHEACEAAGACGAPSVADWDGTTWGVNRSANGRARHPQNGITWVGAHDVCTWLGGRRPTEAEWERATNGLGPHREWPWGATPEPTCDNDTAVFDPSGNTPARYGCDHGGTWAVGLKPAGMSATGTLDMAGNLWGYVEDCWHSSYEGAPADGSAWTTSCTTSNKVVRGGAYSSDKGDMRTSRRNSNTSTVRSANIGARCVRALP
ncbi:MAG: SUMF1/EgtB/PvdO family nonheme iron enzyme [Deltaproteobacteria bacterium]|nr:SUMF1/EgtB/PvdO family nonheme iron enzyme [Deltaproteobacteria bacterium]